MFERQSLLSQFCSACTGSVRLVTAQRLMMTMMDFQKKRGKVPTSSASVLLLPVDE
jgi:hypothetical protein